MVVKIGYAEQPNVVQSCSISTRTVFEKGCHGSQVVELESFANPELDRRSRSGLSSKLSRGWSWKIERKIRDTDAIGWCVLCIVMRWRPSVRNDIIKDLCSDLSR